VSLVPFLCAARAIFLTTVQCQLNMRLEQKTLLEIEDNFEYEFQMLTVLFYKLVWDDFVLGS
jgi:hypothetical protein